MITMITMINAIRNLFENLFGKYKPHDEAVIISCFFNPQNSPYRIKAFNEFYKSIKHLNHQIIECVIGETKEFDGRIAHRTPAQLPESPNIKRIYTESLLWHKEALLNKIISELPKKYKYVFWVDADVIFTNKNWLVEAVEKLKCGAEILQPFEYCVHLNKDEMKPGFNVDNYRGTVSDPNNRHKQLWRSFSANYATTNYSGDENYDRHGHVGFAWGAKREVLEKVPLYDKALIGGADHVIAHAAAGQICHSCIKKSFTDNLDEVIAWSRLFYMQVKGRIGYVKGDLYHIWHGDIDKRQYLKRVQEFTAKTKSITFRDSNGLYVTRDRRHIEYMDNYFRNREVSGDDGFLESMALGYMFNSGLMGGALGGNYMGGMIGDMLNDSENQRNDFGGGNFGGAGSGGTFEVKRDDLNPNQIQEVQDTIPVQNDSIPPQDNLGTMENHGHGHHDHNHDHGPYSGSTFS
jgi:hypothetical protein